MARGGAIAAAVVVGTEKGAALDDPGSPGAGACLPVVGALGLGPVGIPVPGPLPDVADHVVQAISIGRVAAHRGSRSEEHTSELQSRGHLVCRLLLEKKKKR